MAIIGSNVAIITVVGIQGSEKTFSTMEYFPTVGAGDESAQDNVDGWVADISGDWLALVSSAWEMLEVRVSKKKAGVFTDAVAFVNTVGSRDPSVLPPLNTFSLRKNPDNDNREPAGERNVGKGRIAVSGVAEPDQNDGMISSGGRTLAEALATQISGYQEIGAVTTYQMYIQSLATVADPIEVFAPVSSVIYTRQGTQLTRKRR